MNSKASIGLLIIFICFSFCSCKSQTSKYSNGLQHLSILIMKDTITYYNGFLDNTLLVNSIPYDESTVRNIIRDNKNRYEDSLVIFLKLTDKAEKLDQAEQILSLVKESQVKFVGWALTESDKTFFKVNDFQWGSPTPIAMTDPVAVTTTITSDYPALFVEIKPDVSVWSKLMYFYNDTIAEKINDPVKENLKKQIVAYKEKCTRENKKPVYLIKGDNSIRYPQFKNVLEAFKESEVYKFQLVTSQEDISKAVTSGVASTSPNLFTPREDQGYESKYANIETKLTLLLLNSDIIYGYNGNTIENGKTYDYNNLHKLIADQSKKYKEKFVVLIRPSKEVSNKNTVAVLDEMSINKIKRFEMIDMSPEEKEFAEKLIGR